MDASCSSCTQRGDSQWTRLNRQPEARPCRWVSPGGTWPDLLVHPAAARTRPTQWQRCSPPLGTQLGTCAPAQPPAHAGAGKCGRSGAGKRLRQDAALDESLASGGHSQVHARLNTYPAQGRRPVAAPESRWRTPHRQQQQQIPLAGVALSLRLFCQHSAPRAAAPAVPAQLRALQRGHLPSAALSRC